MGPFIKVVLNMLPNKLTLLEVRAWIRSSLYDSSLHLPAMTHLLPVHCVANARSSLSPN